MDGKKLAKYMIDHGVGVSVDRSYIIKKIAYLSDITDTYDMLMDKIILMEIIMVKTRCQIRHICQIEQMN